MGKDQQMSPGNTSHQQKVEEVLSLAWVFGQVVLHWQSRVNPEGMALRVLEAVSLCG